MSAETMQTCAACGNSEPEGSQFCGSCGALFVPADQPRADTSPTEASAPLICASCGNEEPEGSRFCGNCSAALAPADQQTPEAEAVEAWAPLEASTPAPVVEQPSPLEAGRAPSPEGKRRWGWVVAGAAAVLLVAGAVAAAVLTLTGGEDSPEPEPPQALTTVTSDPLPTSSDTELAATLAPRLATLAASQGALSRQVSALSADAASFAALRQAADEVAAGVVRTQGFLEGLASNAGNETVGTPLLRDALTAHLAYAEAISSFPSQPQSFTSAQAEAAIAGAEQTQVAYATLARVEPALAGGIALNYFDHVRLGDLVGTANPAVPTSSRREVDLVSLLVGIRPDDPPGEGRCFGPYGRGSLRVSGVVYRGGYIQCGDDSDGDPSRASGVYRFSGLTFPAGSRLVRITGQAVIDEFSSPSQRGSSVTWTMFYDGTPICSQTVAWTGSRPLPRRLDCKFSQRSSSRGFDVRGLRIQQVASLASSGSLWAGLLNPKIVAEVPR